MGDSTKAEAEETRSWKRYWRLIAAVFVGELLIVCALIAVANPYGNLPHLLLKSHVIMDTNQRFQHPSIARSGRYDSIVIGTSTSKLLRPGALERVFGGRFANLAFDDGRAWEQYQIAKLFAEHTAHPHTLLIGIDSVWCDPDADTHITTYRGFPEWMYDDDPWNDLVWMLNKRTVEISGRRIGNVLGINPDRIPPNGYDVFVPDESLYDLAKARAHIGPVPPASPKSYIATDAERRSWRYPALRWLEELLDGTWQRKAIVIVPVHAAAQPQPGSLAAAREEECKARLAALARRHGVPLVDFRIRSDITMRDENYWDSLHYRVPIAERIVDEIGRALATEQDDPMGDWRILATQRYQSAEQRPLLPIRH